MGCYMRGSNRVTVFQHAYFALRHCGVSVNEHRQQLDSIIKVCIIDGLRSSSNCV